VDRWRRYFESGQGIHRVPPAWRFSQPTTGGVDWVGLVGIFPLHTHNTTTQTIPRTTTTTTVTITHHTHTPSLFSPPSLPSLPPLHSLFPSSPHVYCICATKRFFPSLDHTILYFPFLPFIRRRSNFRKPDHRPTKTFLLSISSTWTWTQRLEHITP
jgi:hypothetical protein